MALEGSSYRDTAKAQEAIDIIRDLGVFERRRISATGCGINSGNKRPATISVDLIALLVLLMFYEAAHGTLRRGY